MHVTQASSWLRTLSLAELLEFGAVGGGCARPAAPPLSGAPSVHGSGLFPTSLPNCFTIRGDFPVSQLKVAPKLKRARSLARHFPLGAAWWEGVCCTAHPHLPGNLQPAGPCDAQFRDLSTLNPKSGQAARHFACEGPRTLAPSPIYPAPRRTLTQCRSLPF
jgi:hypothetical protein